MPSHRPVLTILAFLLLASVTPAAPAPDRAREAKEKLEALKKRLPDLVTRWAEECWPNPKHRVAVRVVRRLGPTQAKVVFRSRSSETRGGRLPHTDEVFTIFLDFYDGFWSATRWESSWMPADY